MEALSAGDPQRIGVYRLLTRLGEGGMGQVYLARSDRGRTVAVKLVRQELARQREFRDRFRQEVASARRVGGDWTAPVLDADTEAPVPWVATGYVAGPSLQRVVSQDHGPLPERSVRILAAGLTRALGDIHAAGIIHRDLKPSNVLVTIDGPRVIDFGIARALETLAEGGLTRTGALVGSPGFMAPEQVRGDRVTPACDVFCLGSVLAHAATGRLPFGTAGSGVHALMFRIAEEPPNLDGVPAPLRELIADCLAKDPGERPPLDAILARTDAQTTLGGAGRTREPWLPAALVAQLGREAVRLLDQEEPEAEAAEGELRAAEAAEAEVRAAEAAEAASEADPAAPPPPGTPPESTPGLDHLPTMVTGPTAPPTPPPGPAYGAPLPAAYGYPQAQPPAYGSPQAPYGYGAPAPYGYAATPPYGPPPPGPPDRGRRGTAVLVAVALVVALGAGGSVYALMRGDGGTHAEAGVSASPGPADNGTGSRAPGSSGPSGSAQNPPTPSADLPQGDPAQEDDPSRDTADREPDNSVPERYVGTWTASYGDGQQRRMTLVQGGKGDLVMSLSGSGPTYTCRWTATLRKAGPPLELNPSTVTFGSRKNCSNGEWSRLTINGDGSLDRELVGSKGTPIRYQKD